MFPFYNPANEVFNHNQSSRKSFSKGNGKLRLSIGTPKKASTSNSTNGDPYSIETGGMSSPNLSIEMIDEEEDSESIPVPIASQPPPPNFEFAQYALSKYKNSIDYGNNLTSNEVPQEKYQLSKIIGDNETTTIVHGFPLAGESDNFSFKQSNIDIGYSSDLDYYSNRNILTNVSDNEELFPVNSAQQPDYAPKLRNSNATTISTSSSSTAVKKTTKTTLENRRSSPPNMTTNNNSNIRSTGLRKSSTSVSTMDLHKVDEQFMNLTTSVNNKKPMSRGTSPVRETNKIKKSESSYQIGNRDYHHHTQSSKNHNKNVTVQFFSKPQRSKTAIDIKSSAGRTLPSSIPRSIPQQQQQSQQIHHHQQQQHIITNTAIVQQQESITTYVPHPHHPVESSKESQDYLYLTSHHDSVFNALCNRLTSLELIRNQTR